MINLGLNKKERSENIMIVDLVRNDMSRFSKPGSVDVKELCEVYPFKQVHQMISTIESEIDQNLNFGKIISSTFPMGSMTGAPKVKAMELIEKYEIPYFEIIIENLNLMIPLKKLKIVKNQNYIFNNIGIPKINTKDIFDISNKAKIIVNINLI